MGPRQANPLLHLHNVIVTPHAAYYSEEPIGTMRRIASEEPVHVLSGLPAPLACQHDRCLRPGVADGLCDPGCLRDAPDLAALHPGASANSNTRLHAIMRSGTSRRIVRELCRTELRKGGTGRLHMRRARRELV